MTHFIDVSGPHAAISPRAIYCVGRNYAEHAAELHNPLPSEPVIFTKTPHSLRLPENSGALAFPKETFHHELEIVVMVSSLIACKTRCGWESLSAIGLGIDLTRREVQTKLKKEGLPWTIAKSFAGSAIIAPLIPLSAFHSPPDDLEFRLWVGKELRQEGRMRDMIFKVPEILTYLADMGPLYPHDLIFTGTPKGVGPQSSGEHFRMELINPSFSWNGVL